MALSAGLYDHLYNNTGTYGSPTFTEITAIGDVDVTNEANEIEVKLRKNTYVSNLVGLKKFGVSFPIAVDTADSTFTALQTAFNSKTVGEYFLFYKGDSSTSGSKAIRFPAYVTKISNPQKLEDLDVADIQLSPSANVFSTATSTDPVIYTVA